MVGAFVFWGVGVIGVSVCLGFVCVCVSLCACLAQVLLCDCESVCMFLGTCVWACVRVNQVAREQPGLGSCTSANVLKPLVLLPLSSFDKWVSVKGHVLCFTSIVPPLGSPSIT